MLAFGVRNEEQSEAVVVPGVGIATATAKVKLKQAYGIYVKPKANVTDALELFGRLGYSHVKLGVDASVAVPGLGTVSMGDSGSDGGFSYGLGANFKFSPTTYVGVDYMRYVKKDGVKVDGLTVGVGFRF